jgi:molybdate/tungstate transport system ATP-binding protein
VEAVTVLEVSGLRQDHGDFRLGPLDLTVDEEVLAVLGPSGSGKTTLLSLLAGVSRADAGRVALDGARLDGRPPERRGTVLVFQDGALFPHLTALENVTYAAAASADVDGLVATLDIEDVLDRPAGRLSGGEAQRVALARALAADPGALLLDEPLANLDAPIRRRLRADLRELLAALPIPVVYVTHDQTEASSVGDRVAVMRAGRFEQVGSPSAVFARPATPFVAGFTGGANVFRGRIEGELGLRWASTTLATDTGEFEAGTAVWFAVRPEYLKVEGGQDGRPGTGLEATVVDRLFEGGTYRLVVEPDGTGTTVEVTVLAPTYERAGLDDRGRVTVRVPPAAVHIIGRVDGGEPAEGSARADSTDRLM